VVNFFNEADYALATGTCGGFDSNWERNNIYNKPDRSAGIGFYYFDGANCTRNYFGGISSNVVESLEKRAMIARTRTAAVGALGGVIQGSVDLATSFGFGSTRPEHSAQFARPIQEVVGYYVEILQVIQP
jgi:hypothetical protein